MIHIFYGEDEFSVQEKLTAMKNELLPVEIRNLNITEFNGVNLGAGELINACSTIPFMSDKRMVIVKGLFSHFAKGTKSADSKPESTSTIPVDWEHFNSFISVMPKTTYLVFTDLNISKTDPLFAIIKSHASVKTFPLPRYNELTQWISERAISKNTRIDRAAIQLLSKLIGNDLRILANEIEKLSTYRNGEPIRAIDVEAMVVQSKESSIFYAVDSLLEKRLDVAINLVEQLLISGMTSSYILAMIARQVRLLILCKELKNNGVPQKEFSKHLSISGYPLRKTVEQERKFSMPELHQTHRNILKIDLTLKTSGKKDELLLDLMTSYLF